jgi:hypothetical protein
VQRVDRWVGLALAALGAVVLWTAREFPNVPGQKVGAAFLPMLAGAGLVVCASLLVLRSFRARPGPAGEAPAPLAAGARLSIDADGRALAGGGRCPRPLPCGDLTPGP